MQHKSDSRRSGHSQRRDLRLRPRPQTPMPLSVCRPPLHPQPVHWKPASDRQHLRSLTRLHGTSADHTVLLMTPALALFVAAPTQNANANANANVSRKYISRLLDAGRRPTHLRVSSSSWVAAHLASRLAAITTHHRLQLPSTRGRPRPAQPNMSAHLMVLISLSNSQSFPCPLFFP